MLAQQRAVLYVTLKKIEDKSKAVQECDTTDNFVRSRAEAECCYCEVEEKGEQDVQEREERYRRVDHKAGTLKSIVAESRGSDDGVYWVHVGSGRKQMMKHLAANISQLPPQTNHKIYQNSIVPKIHDLFASSSDRSSALPAWLRTDSSLLFPRCLLSRTCVIGVL